MCVCLTLKVGKIFGIFSILKPISWYNITFFSRMDARNFEWLAGNCSDVWKKNDLFLFRQVACLWFGVYVSCVLVFVGSKISFCRTWTAVTFRKTTSLMAFNPVTKSEGQEQRSVNVKYNSKLLCWENVVKRGPFINGVYNMPNNK